MVSLLGWRIARQLVLAHPTAAILAALDDSVDAGHTAIESFTVATRETSWQNLKTEESSRHQPRWVETAFFRRLGGTASRAGAARAARALTLAKRGIE